MFHPVRHYAAQGRLRYRKDGFDLDLAYVTSRIMMWLPKENTFQRKFYRSGPHTFVLPTC
eukprot:4500903-Amphidinium_carterae.1